MFVYGVRVGGASIAHAPMDSWDTLPSQGSRAHTEAVVNGRWLFAIWVWREEGELNEYD